MTTETKSESIAPLEIAGYSFVVARPHQFGLVIEGVVEAETQLANDYLHRILLSPLNREEFLSLIDEEGLVVCKNLKHEDESYRKVRGKSSFGRLSQAEYYHHDGCSCPEKPRVNEIRLPHPSIPRNVATAIAPFEDVVRAQLTALPDRLAIDSEILDCRAAFSTGGTLPDVNEWDRIQGRVTRLIRKEMDAESSREYFRQVDKIANAYVVPWEAGESRIMLNAHDDLKRTMQHRRAFQKPKVAGEKNGSLVKRWTAEEYSCVNRVRRIGP